MILALPEVMNNLRPSNSDLDDEELALMAAALIVTREWELSGKLPAPHTAMWPDVRLLLESHGYKTA